MKAGEGKGEEEWKATRGAGNEKGAERKGKNEKNGKGAVCKQSPQQGRHESRVNREAAVNSCDISFIRQVSAATDHERSPTTGNLKATAPRVERIGVEGRGSESTPPPAAGVRE